MKTSFGEDAIFTGLCIYLFKAFFLMQWNPVDWERIDRIGTIAAWCFTLMIIRMNRYHP